MVQLTVDASPSTVGGFKGLVDLVRVGGILRAERKKLGKSIELMAEEIALGTTTISSIERGLPTVSMEKYQYYAENLEKGMLFGKASEADKKILALKEKLKDIEEILLANPDKAFADLSKLNKAEKTESIPILRPIVYYLKGRFYLAKKEWKLAEDFFSQAVQITENQPELAVNNLTTACYTELGIILHHRDRFREALIYANKGLEYYVSSGERSHYYESLLLNKSIYLERLNLLEKSLISIEDLE
jgi:transcriptional regulator with XRE-family HTH domain